jgi:hypothetical protein
MKKKRKLLKNEGEKFIERCENRYWRLALTLLLGLRVNKTKSLLFGQE